MPNQENASVEDALLVARVRKRLAEIVQREPVRCDSSADTLAFVKANHRLRIPNLITIADRGCVRVHWEPDVDNLLWIQFHGNGRTEYLAMVGGSGPFHGWASIFDVLSQAKRLGADWIHQPNQRR